METIMEETRERHRKNKRRNADAHSGRRRQTKKTHVIESQSDHEDKNNQEADEKKKEVDEE